jgi:hypothetical protein
VRLPRLRDVLSSQGRKLRQGYAQIPLCYGERVEACIELLRAAGVTGRIEIVRLSPDRSFYGGVAGRVTTTTPPAGELLAPGKPIAVYVNAGTAAELSREDLSRIARVKERYEQEVRAREQIFRDSPRPRPNRADRPPSRATLTIGLLERLDARIREGGALLADAWAPGLTDDQIDELLRPAGIDLPEEARVWWRWHNGTRDDAPANARAFAWRWPVSLQDAVESYEHCRALTLGLYDIDGLLCPLGEKPRIYFDCTGARDEPVPVYSQPDDTEPPLPVLGSIGDLVLVCLEYLDRGVWTIDPDGAIRGDPDKARTQGEFL